MALPAAVRRLVCRSSLSAARRPRRESPDTTMQDVSRAESSTAELARRRSVLTPRTRAPRGAMRARLRGIWWLSLATAVVAMAWFAAGPSRTSLLLHAAGMAAQETDTDGDTMPDAWETFFGLESERPGRRHWRSRWRWPDERAGVRRAAASGGPARAVLRRRLDGLLRHVGGGAQSEHDRHGARRARAAERGRAASSRISSRWPRASGNRCRSTPCSACRPRWPSSSNRTCRWPRIASMTWGTSGIGASLDSGAPAPATTWYFAEGATGPFLLYYLFQNPGTTPATVTVRYLIEGGPPVTTTRTLPPQSRTTIFVNGDDPALAVASRGRDCHVGRADLRRTGDVRECRRHARRRVGVGGVAAAVDAVVLRRRRDRARSSSLPLAAESGDDGGDGDGDVSPERRLDGVEGLQRARRGTTDGVVQRRGRVGSGAGGAGDRPGVVHGDARRSRSSASARCGGRTGRGTKATPRPAARRPRVSWAVPEGRDGGATREQTYVLIGNTTTTPGQVRLTLIPDTGAASTRDLPIAPGRAADGQRRPALRADRGALQRDRRQPRHAGRPARGGLRAVSLGERRPVLRRRRRPRHPGACGGRATPRRRSRARRPRRTRPASPSTPT